MNLIINGDFETNIPNECDISLNCTLNYHSHALLPWIINPENATINLIGTGYSKAYTGNHSLDLSSNSPCTISQYVTVLQNQSYTLEFFVKSTTDRNESGVYWIDDYPIQAFYSTNTEWKSVLYTFIALSNVTVVNIGTILPSTGPLIDAVTLTAAVPTPSPSSAPQSQPDALQQGLVFGGIIIVILIFVVIGIAILSKKPHAKPAENLESAIGSTTEIDPEEPKRTSTIDVPLIRKSSSIPIDINRIQLFAVNPANAYNANNQSIQLIHPENIEHYSRIKIEQSKLQDKLNSL